MTNISYDRVSARFIPNMQAGCHFGGIQNRPRRPGGGLHRSKDPDFVVGAVVPPALDF